MQKGTREGCPFAWPLARHFMPDGDLIYAKAVTNA
jgi:hypothetical protein